METTNWLWPVPFTTSITQYYTGRYEDRKHSGIDIASSNITGKNVYASKDGVIDRIFTGCNNVDGYGNKVSCNSSNGCKCNNYGYINYYDEDGIFLYTLGYCNDGLGNAVIIRHTDSTEASGHSYSQYVHLTDIYVKAGDVVKKGQLIGTVGSTGESTAAHLHYSLSTNSNTVSGGRINNNPGVITYDPSVEVKFDLNYSGSTSIYMAFNPQESYGYLPTPSRTNYRFDGWYTDREGGSKFTTSTNVPDYPHTLYAHWTYVSYVTFDYNYEHGPTSETIAFVPGVAYGSGMPTPTRANYRFDGWFTNREGGNRHTSSTNALGWTEYTLYAHWTWMATVTFDLNYSGCPTYQTKMYEPQTAYGFLPTPTRAHYRFDGWYTSREGGSKFTTATIVPGYAHTLYAHWTWMVEVKFYRNHNSSDTTITKTAYCLGGSTYGSSMPTPSRSGYVFKGWFPERSGNGTAWTSSSTVPSYDHNLYAHWKTN